MNLPGIKTEYTAKGHVKRVIIDGAAKSELVEDLLDVIAYEEAKADDTGERHSWDDVKAEITKKHKLEE